MDVVRNTRRRYGRESGHAAVGRLSVRVQSSARSSAEAVGMRESKRRRRGVAVDERQGEIEYDLAGQVLCAGRFQRRERDGAGGRVDDQLAVFARLGEGDNVLEVDENYLLSTYTVDVVGAISAAQVFTPAMRDAKAGTFLASGGVAAVDPQPPYASLALGKAGLRTTATLLHRQLKDEGVHVASVTIYGPIAPNTPASPELIAERYWELHAQPASDWTDESVFDGK
jgi:NAD(P)-dependent dehydrogenase (short-subunit alcohol dehydrogenase family)